MAGAYFYFNQPEIVQQMGNFWILAGIGVFMLFLLIGVSYLVKSARARRGTLKLLLLLFFLSFMAVPSAHADVKTINLVDVISPYNVTTKEYSDNHMGHYTEATITTYKTRVAVKPLDNCIVVVSLKKPKNGVYEGRAYKSLSNAILIYPNGTIRWVDVLVSLLGSNETVIPIEVTVTEREEEHAWIINDDPYEYGERLYYRVDAKIYINGVLFKTVTLDYYIGDPGNFTATYYGDGRLFISVLKDIGVDCANPVVYDYDWSSNNDTNQDTNQSGGASLPDPVSVVKEHPVGAGLGVLSLLAFLLLRRG